MQTVEPFLSTNRQGIQKESHLSAAALFHLNKENIALKGRLLNLKYRALFDDMAAVTQLLKKGQDSSTLAKENMEVKMLSKDSQIAFASAKVVDISAIKPQTTVNHWVHSHKLPEYVLLQQQMVLHTLSKRVQTVHHHLRQAMEGRTTSQKLQISPDRSLFPVGSLTIPADKHSDTHPAQAKTVVSPGHLLQIHETLVC